jgi:hypothetical protein
MMKNRKNALLTGIAIVLASLFISILVEAKIDQMANPLTNGMPISWDEAYFKLIKSPDEADLEKGEILVAEKKLGGDTILAESIGLIEAAPEECVRVVRDYNHYTSIMPYTVESRIVRSFSVEGENAGARTVDFWTRVRVLGFDTSYLIRVEHLAYPESHRYLSFWTLVRNPAEVSGCIDSNGRPCENDLDMNIGSSQFEPYKGNPNRTLHTYTLKIEGKSWMQCLGLRIGCGSSMRDVTKAIRKAVIKEQQNG